MRAITTFQVVDCNKALEVSAPGWRVRLHDACGRQTLSLVWEENGASRSAGEEAAREEAAREGTADEGTAREAVAGFFASVGTPVEFSSDGQTFWAAE